LPVGSSVPGGSVRSEMTSNGVSTSLTVSGWAIRSSVATRSVPRPAGAGAEEDE
jgi:hypothetical protein